MSQKILIADDDSIVLKIVQHKLQNCAYIVTTVRDRPDLIISDLWQSQKAGMGRYAAERVHLGTKVLNIVSPKES